MTGASGSGKSTLLLCLAAKIAAYADPEVVVRDGMLDEDADGADPHAGERLTTAGSSAGLSRRAR